jgi:hypothetical protein
MKQVSNTVSKNSDNSKMSKIEKKHTTNNNLKGLTTITNKMKQHIVNRLQKL